MTVRIAMWSGPRSLSTAMMRSWESRPDTVVTDEPFYAAFLSITGIDHPMAAESMASQPTDWRVVAGRISGPAPRGAEVWFQKHMTHHMVPEIGRDWFPGHRHAFLIREPEHVVASYAARRARMTAFDLGYDVQVELFDEVTRRCGATPPVIEVRDLLANPRAALAALCRALDVPFREAMLSWPAGRRASDGVWGAHWYAGVEASTGFRQARRARPSLDDEQRRLAEACRASFERLARHRLAGTR